MIHRKTVRSRKLKVKSLGMATLLTVIFSLSTVPAQESIPTTGGGASGSGGSVSYSVGQVFYTTNTRTNGSVVQGVQQPYEISVVTAIEDATGISLMVAAYPNPAIDLLTLKVDNVELSTLNIRLYDMNGKFLQNEKIISNETTIVMSNLAPATYLLKVMQDLREVKTFKIIKH